MNLYRNEIDETLEGFKVSFVTDSHTVVTVYQNDEITEGEVRKTAYSRDEKTGNLIKDGSGAVYFSLAIAEGYEFFKFEVNSELIEKIEEVENDKDLELYVIKGITADISVNIVTSQAQVEEDGFKVNFTTDENVSVTVYDTKDYEDGKISNVAYARDSSTGELDKSLICTK